MKSEAKVIKMKLRIRTVEQQMFDYLVDIANGDEVYVDFGLDSLARTILSYIDKIEIENEILKNRLHKILNKLLTYEEAFDFTVYKQFQKECLDILNGIEKKEGEK